MRLDLTVLADLAVRFTPDDYVRVTRLANAATPLGMGYGATRFASPEKTFKVLYLAWDLTTAVAETVVRDRFQAKAYRFLSETEVDLWGVTNVTATRPLTLIDLRATGLIRLGVSTEAARGKAQAQGRRLSQVVHDRTDADGFLYASRLTGAACVCVYERSVSGLEATPVITLRDQPDLVLALRALNVTLRPTP